MTRGYLLRTYMRFAAVVLLLTVAAACSKAYVSPETGPRAELAIATQETRGTVGYMTPQECRQRIGAHLIVDLAASSSMLKTFLPADEDAVLVYDYDQPEHLGPVGKLLHCHVAFAFHPRNGERYLLEISSAESCRLDMQDAEKQPVSGVQFAAARCATLPTPLTPGFPPP